MPFQSEKQRRYLHANHPEIAKRWERDYAGGGRIGFDSGSNGITLGSDKYNITFEPEASGSLSSRDLGEGYEVDQKNIAYGVDTTANIGPLEIGIDYKKFLDKFDVTKDDVTVEKDTNRDRSIAYMLGLNLEDLYAKIDSDRDFKNFYLTLRYEFKGGGTPAHEAGIYGLAEGGQLVSPSKTGERPGYQGWDPSGGAPQATETQSAPPDRGPPGGGDPGMTYTAPHVPHYKEKEETKKFAIQEDIRRREEEKGGEEYYGLRDLQIKQKGLQTNIRDKIEGDWRRYMDPTTFDKVRNLMGVTSLSGIIKEIFKGIKRTSDMNAFMQDLKDLGLAGGAPGTNDPLYDQLWLHLEKQKGKYRYDDEGGPEGPEGPEVPQETGITYANIENTNREQAASSQWRQEQEKVDRSKQMAYWRMMMAPYMSAQGGRVPAGYNTGGLSNLFKLKNV
jgi:hypothetical protein